jgi:hypothetical protein
VKGCKIPCFLTCYCGFVDKKSHAIGSSGAERAASFEELAAQQGVTAIDDFETLLGPPVSDDKSVEEFSASLRECVERKPSHRLAMNAAIVDTDVLSMLFKGDTRRLPIEPTSQADCQGSRL